MKIAATTIISLILSTGLLAKDKTTASTPPNISPSSTPSPKALTSKEKADHQELAVEMLNAQVNYLTLRLTIAETQLQVQQAQSQRDELGRRYDTMVEGVRKVRKVESYWDLDGRGKWLDTRRTSTAPASNVPTATTETQEEDQPQPQPVSPVSPSPLKAKE